MTRKFSHILLICSQGTKKTLVLREIPEDGVIKLLSTKESLAAYDVAVLVYDRWVRKVFRFNIMKDDTYCVVVLFLLNIHLFVL